MALHPLEVAGRRDLLLIDVRPLDERRSELGFLPASMGIPLVQSPEAGLAVLQGLEHPAGLVLYCTSGRRSAAAQEALAGRVEPLFDLEGGMLAWEAAGLPICRAPDEPVECPPDVRAFRRHLVACFVGMNTEVALDHARTEVAPYEMLQACFVTAGVDWDEPTIDGLFRVLDWAGVMTRRAGGDLRVVAENLGLMYAMLGAFEARLRGGA